MGFNLEVMIIIMITIMIMITIGTMFAFRSPKFPTVT